RVIIFLLFRPTPIYMAEIVCFRWMAKIHLRLGLIRVFSGLSLGEEGKREKTKNGAGEEQ
ncbi:hypothetical protein PSY24_23365, partial [Shigella flexneri]|nr:hypothetical protein [Shigella flexneri]